MHQVHEVSEGDSPVPTKVTPPEAGDRAAGRDLQIFITTEPADAEVYENGARVCSGSPCVITYSGRDADPAKRHKLYISRGDLCDAETRTVRGGDRLHLSLKCLPPTEPNDRQQLPY